jgi:hypothetical protein
MGAVQRISHVRELLALPGGCTFHAAVAVARPHFAVVHCAADDAFLLFLSAEFSSEQLLFYQASVSSFFTVSWCLAQLVLPPLNFTHRRRRTLRRIA